MISEAFPLLHIPIVPQIVNYIFHSCLGQVRLENYSLFTYNCVMIQLDCFLILFLIAVPRSVPCFTLCITNTFVHILYQYYSILIFISVIDIMYTESIFMKLTMHFYSFSRRNSWLKMARICQPTASFMSTYI
jgi:hypothetical protein